MKKKELCFDILSVALLSIFLSTFTIFSMQVEMQSIEECVEKVEQIVNIYLQTGMALPSDRLYVNERRRLKKAGKNLQQGTEEYDHWLYNYKLLKNMNGVLDSLIKMDAYSRLIDDYNKMLEKGQFEDDQGYLNEHSLSLNKLQRKRAQKALNELNEKRGLIKLNNPSILIPSIPSRK